MKPLVRITLWDDAIGIATYLVWMFTFGWILGLLVRMVVS